MQLLVYYSVGWNILCSLRQANITDHVAHTSLSLLEKKNWSVANVRNTILEVPPRAFIRSHLETSYKL